MVFCVVSNIPTSDKLQSLQSQIKEIQDLRAQTSNWTATAEENSIQAEKNIIDVEKMNEETTNTLKRAMDYIQTEGATALAKAISKSDELGQQSDQMSEIAREARQYVDVYVFYLYKCIQLNKLHRYFIYAIIYNIILEKRQK